MEATRKEQGVRTDGEILGDVLHELQWDSRVRESDVGVRVHEGVVTLTGVVGDYSQKLAGARAAHRVRGVLDVADEIEVRYASPDAVTDTELAQAVRHALEWDVLVDARRMRSTVSEGFVTLEGEVNSLAQREDADRAVRRLKGVRGVLNKITVKPVRADSSALRRKIEEALERRAAREANHISVDVEDGSVTLTGRVHSWQERDSVVGAIAHAAGVQSVRDRLRVDPWF
ncbi:MAG: BON domain-containing protein [Acidobacteriota bacterium]